MHTCIGDRFAPTHDCWCAIGSNHLASEHRAQMDARREADSRIAAEDR